jgi:hypothetical protein
MSKPLRKHPQLLTEIVFLVGNGASREGFDLNSLVGKGTIIGCNALYRDFNPDILICQDAKMARELVDNNYSGLVLTGRGIGVLPTNNISWRAGDARTSGVFGLRFISSVMKPKVCYVLGMDGYAGNVYEGTRNYAINKPIKPHKVAAQYAGAMGGMNTVNVNTLDTWQVVDRPNYKFISYKEFSRISSIA